MTAASPAVMQELQANCLAVLFSTQTHPVGFATLDVPDGAALQELLSEKELQVLALYEKLRTVALQKFVLEAESSSSGESFSDESVNAHGKTEEELEKEVVEARASYELKHTIIDMTLATDPILKSVHTGPTTGKRERALLSLLTRRDTLSLTHAQLSASIQSTLEQLTTTQRAKRRAQAKNKELAARLFTILEARKKELRKRRGPEYEGVEEELKETRVRWDMIRNVVQAVVVASGVDWVRDEGLRALVLSCGEE